MNKDNRAILYALAIGDGNLHFRERTKDGKYKYTSCELRIGHGPKQKEYLEHKRDLVLGILGGVAKIRKNTHTIKGKKYNTFSFQKTHNYFRQMHGILCKHDRKKRITPEVLSFLNVHSLAIWFMDDGTIGHNKNKAGEITSLWFSICTQFESVEEARLVADWMLLKFGIECRPYQSKGRWNVRGATQATLLLSYLIEPYMIPCMHYKIAPATRFVFRKSARHPQFSLGEDIVRPTGNYEPVEIEDKELL